MKLNIRQIALAGMMLALLTIIKYIDIIMIKTPLGYSWIEFYMIFVVILVLILPISISSIVLLCAPFIWFALGQTYQISPLSFFLDYVFPLFVMEIVYLARFFKKKLTKYIAIIILIIVAFILKFISHIISGVVAFDTSLHASALLNAPMVFMTMFLSIIFITPIIPRLNELQKFINNQGLSW